MKKTAAVIVSLVALMISCAPSQQVTSFWRNPEETGSKQYKSIFIVVVTQNRAARTVIETDLAQAAAAEGIRAVRSVDAFPANFGSNAVPSEDEILAKVTESKCDGILTMSLLDTKSEQYYVPGTTTYVRGYAPYPYYGYYGRFYPYYNHSYSVVSTPGYYVTDKAYFIETNLYDAVTKQIQWSMQSTAYNPTDLASFSKEFCRLLVDQLKTGKETTSAK